MPSLTLQRIRQCSNLSYYIFMVIGIYWLYILMFYYGAWDPEISPFYRDDRIMTWDPTKPHHERNQMSRPYMSEAYWALLLGTGGVLTFLSIARVL
mmetsp:Transcript_29122/g.78091  ORF Transcript_29122/g.78091 Transcript_29122/m.78091 type:complete len:96 (+) Transcript_29122:167-454(+)